MLVEHRTEIEAGLGVKAEVHMIINPEKVRSYCIKMKLYTAGSNEHYDKMLTACRSGDWTPADVAFDIWNHTTNSRKEALRDQGYVRESLLFDIWNECMDVRLHSFDEE